MALPTDYNRFQEILARLYGGQPGSLNDPLMRLGSGGRSDSGDRIARVPIPGDLPSSQPLRGSQPGGLNIGKGLTALQGSLNPGPLVPPPQIPVDVAAGTDIAMGGTGAAAGSGILETGGAIASWLIETLGPAAAALLAL